MIGPLRGVRHSSSVTATAPAGVLFAAELAREVPVMQHPLAGDLEPRQFGPRRRRACPPIATVLSYTPRQRNTTVYRHARIPKSAHPSDPVRVGWHCQPSLTAKIPTNNLLLQLRHRQSLEPPAPCKVRIARIMKSAPFAKRKLRSRKRRAPQTTFPASIVGRPAIG